MRKTYGYMLNRIKQQTKTYLEMSYTHWEKYLRIEDTEKSEAHKRLSSEYRTAADALFFLAQEEGWKWEEYEAMINEAKKITEK